MKVVKVTTPNRIPRLERLTLEILVFSPNKRFKRSIVAAEPVAYVEHGLVLSAVATHVEVTKPARLGPADCRQRDVPDFQQAIDACPNLGACGDARERALE